MKKIFMVLAFFLAVLTMAACNGEDEEITETKITETSVSLQNLTTEHEKVQWDDESEIWYIQFDGDIDVLGAEALNGIDFIFEINGVRETVSLDNFDDGTNTITFTLDVPDDDEQEIVILRALLQNSAGNVTIHDFDETVTFAPSSVDESDDKDDVDEGYDDSESDEDDSTDDEGDEGEDDEGKDENGDTDDNGDDEEDVEREVVENEEGTELLNDYDDEFIYFDQRVDYLIRGNHLEEGHYIEGEFIQFKIWIHEDADAEQIKIWRNIENNEEREVIHDIVSLNETGTTDGEYIEYYFELESSSILNNYGIFVSHIIDSEGNKDIQVVYVPSRGWHETAKYNVMVSDAFIVEEEENHNVVRFTINSYFDDIELENINDDRWLDYQEGVSDDFVENARNVKVEYDGFVSVVTVEIDPLFSNGGLSDVDILIDGDLKSLDPIYIHSNEEENLNEDDYQTGEDFDYEFLNSEDVLVDHGEYLKLDLTLDRTAEIENIFITIDGTEYSLLNDELHLEEDSNIITTNLELSNEIGSHYFGVNSIVIDWHDGEHTHHEIVRYFDYTVSDDTVSVDFFEPEEEEPEFWTFEFTENYNDYEMIIEFDGVILNQNGDEYIFNLSGIDGWIEGYNYDEIVQLSSDFNDGDQFYIEFNTGIAVNEEGENSIVFEDNSFELH